MATTQTIRLWQPQQLNNSGIRRLKLIDADTVKLLPVGIQTNQVSLLPQGDVVLYEFIFPSDLSCVANTALQKTNTGDYYWVQNLGFSLPHIQDEVLLWMQSNVFNKWLAITEAYNGSIRLFGGTPYGLDLSMQATTGATPKDSNPMSFSLSGEQLYPYHRIPGYEDESIFPTNAGFTHGFSLAFES
ncbi:hypothetical protein [Dyadobacter diqingensis]|uniref:hypothetical protein n=1 Tax=Dyadobacter diqingensis TaxID=2938121 RepID=UPI0020C364DD|nr:hypothetical protein [Dyadobacter diqingensis]